MATLLLAVFVASLLGSLHCACMCGPIAIWSSGSGLSNKLDRVELAKRILGYHIGRLWTYLILGVVAGVTGKALGLIGDGVGLQSAAARFAGFVLITLGVWRICRMLIGESVPQSSSHSIRHWTNRLSSHLARFVAKSRPLIARQTLIPRSIAFGAVTVLLPCGWLYLFVIFASGSGSILSAMGVMVAFWLGTIPSLVALVLGALHLTTVSRQAWPRLMPIIGAMVLILFGLHTASGRASADMNQWRQRVLASMANSDSTPMSLQKLEDQPLPCCQHAN